MKKIFFAAIVIFSITLLSSCGVNDNCPNYAYVDTVSLNQ